MDTLLQITDLHQFRGERHVLKGLSLTVNRGEILGLIGRNGSGKSTLAKVIAGEVQPRSGEMRLDGEPYRARSRGEALSAGVSVIEQDHTYPADVSVVRTMYRNTFMADWDEADLLERAREILGRTEFDIDLEARVGDLDHAERSIAEVLRVLAEEAQLVIFDEVSALLNDLEISQLHHAARRLRDQGCAIIHVAHRLEEISALSDRIVVLSGGRVALEAPQGTPLTELTRAMLQRDVADTTPLARERGDALLAVRGLQVPGSDAAVDFTVHAGEVVAVVGLRGSGAERLVDALAGQVEAPAERVELAGEVAESVAACAERMTYVTAPTEDLRDAKISDAVAGVDEGESEILQLRRAIAAVQHLELTTSNIQGKVGDLSGGDRQKVLIATAARDAGDVVFFAYPTRGVDIGAKAMTYELIHELVRGDHGVVVLTVDLSEVMSLCDRVLVVHEGRFVADLPTGETNEDVIMAYAMTGAAPEPSRGRGRRGSAQPA